LSPGGRDTCTRSHQGNSPQRGAPPHSPRRGCCRSSRQAGWFTGDRNEEGQWSRGGSERETRGWGVSEWGCARSRSRVWVFNEAEEGIVVTIPKQRRGEYTQLCPTNQTHPHLATLVLPGAHAPKQTRSELNHTNNRHPTKQVHDGWVELGQTQLGSNPSQARI
jgi:hypothetical protein